MSRLPNEDLFEGSKMTFGEHLEELRVALFRSMIGLAIGIIIGFTISSYVIGWIEGPLINALNEFNLKRTKDTLEDRYGELPTELVTSLEQQRRLYEDVFIEVSEMKRLLGLANGTSTEVEPGPPTTELVATRIWRNVDGRMQALGTQEPFFAWLKVGVLTGLTLSGPWIFWQIWMFVAEGLYPQEKGYVYIYLPFSLILFVAGASLAFFFAFKPVLKFLFSFNAVMNIDPIPRISDWLGFVLLMPLGFGIGFQLPLVMLFLNRIGLFTIESYLSQWKIAILIIFVAAMVLTPADPTSMLLLAMPLTILYFLGVLLCKYLPKRESPFGEGYDPA